MFLGIIQLLKFGREKQVKKTNLYVKAFCVIVILLILFLKLTKAYSHDAEKTSQITQNNSFKEAVIVLGDQDFYTDHPPTIEQQVVSNQKTFKFTVTQFESMYNAEVESYSEGFKMKDTAKISSDDKFSQYHSTVLPSSLVFNFMTDANNNIIRLRITTSIESGETQEVQEKFYLVSLIINSMCINLLSHDLSFVQAQNAASDLIMKLSKNNLQPQLNIGDMHLELTENKWLNSNRRITYTINKK